MTEAETNMQLMQTLDDAAVRPVSGGSDYAAFSASAHVSPTPTFTRARKPAVLVPVHRATRGRPGPVG